MKTADTFLTCVGAMGITTGALSGFAGLYFFNSGLYNAPVDVVYNQIYPTGAHVTSGSVSYILDEGGNILFDESGYGIVDESGISGPVVLSSSMALIQLNQHVTNNFLNTQSVFEVGYQYTGNFGIILDIEYSGCNKTGALKGRDYVLLSTVNTPNGLNSGFVVGINDSNRLFYRSNDYSYTNPRELTTHDFVYVGMTSNKYVKFGIFSVADDTFYGSSIREAESLSTNNLYIGGFTSNALPYTGFVGKINNAILFNEGITNSDIDTCVTCSFVTGYNVVTTPYLITGYPITGSLYSGVTQNITQYTVFVSGQIIKMDNTIVTVLIPSGVTGIVTTGEVLVPLYGATTVTYNRSGYAFNYDYGTMSTFAISTVEFDQGLVSGDILVVDTYQTPNHGIGLRPTGFTAPSDSGFIQLYANGLDETSGVDFTVAHNQLIGYLPNDILSYDVLSNNSIVTGYSGYWQNSHITMISGLLFPPTSQFLENTGLGAVIITGFTGVNILNPYYPSFNFDVYINGQNLVSGLQYSVYPTGTSGFAVFLSGANLPWFYGTLLYNNTGAITGVTNVDVPELSFIPYPTGRNPNTFYITNATKTWPITGFNEQIWINGLRMVQGIDYYKHSPCSCSTGALTVPIYTGNLYSSEADIHNLWNLLAPVPPFMVIFASGDPASNEIVFTSNTATISYTTAYTNWMKTNIIPSGKRITGLFTWSLTAQSSNIQMGVQSYNSVTNVATSDFTYSSPGYIAGESIPFGFTASTSLYLEFTPNPTDQGTAGNLNETIVSY